MKTSTRILIAAALLCGSAFTLMAQAQPPVPPTPPAQPAQPPRDPMQPVRPTTPGTPVATGTETAPLPNITQDGISFRETSLQTVVELLAQQAKMKLIIPEALPGSITMYLPGVDAREALRNILESKKYTLVEDKNGVFTVQAKAEEQPEVEAYTLDYASVKDMAPAIKTMLSSRGKLEVMANTVVISDVRSNLTKIEALIKQMDTKTPQVMIEARLYEMVRNPKKELGVDWSSTLGGKGFAVNFGGGADGTSPFNWPVGATGAKHMPATAVLTTGQFAAVLRFLNSDTDTELIATPRIVTADNREATIKIVSEEPIPNFQFNTQRAAFEISGFNYKEIGNILKVTPHVNRKDGFITLDLDPEVSNIATFRQFSGSGGGSSDSGSTSSGGGGSGLSASIPVVNTRNLSTRVLMKNGDTLAIGGLVQTNKVNSYTKVPVIGDIPVLGMFFRSKVLMTEKRNLLIFITPNEIPAGGKTGLEDQAEGLKQGEVYTDDVWIPKDNAKPYHLKPVRQEDLDKKKGGVK